MPLPVVNASHGDDTARGMAVAAATIRQVIERELPTPCLNCSQPLATHGGDPNGCPVFEPSELTAEEYAIERRVLYRQAREMNRLRAAVVSAVGVLRRGGDGLDHVTACEVWDGSQSCADRESAPCDGCIAAAQVDDAVRLLEMGGPLGDLAATEPKP